MKQEKDVFQDFLKSVGQNIKKRRKDNKLSLEKLGLEIGLTKMHVHTIESGSNITLNTILRIMIALSMKPEELLKYDHKLKKSDLERLVENSKGNRKRSRK